MSKFYELSQDAVDTFQTVLKSKIFSIEMNFQFIGSESQKSLIKISKISDQFSFLLEKDILISINEDLMTKFDDESIQILFEQEIDRIVVNIESGKIKLVKPDLTTFSSLINKYGIEKISRANQIETLSVEQSEDADADFIV
jgi:hypothetical protein